MQISEKELEDFIYEDLKHNRGFSLQARGLQTIHTALFDTDTHPKVKWLRQFDLGAYGRIDIVGYFRYSDTIVVELFELKVNPLVSADIDQILRYKRGISLYFGKRFNLKFKLYLVGSGIDSGHYIHNELNDFTLVEFTYSLDGIDFISHTNGWIKTSSDSFNAFKSLKNAEAVHGY